MNSTKLSTKLLFLTAFPVLMLLVTGGVAYYYSQCLAEITFKMYRHPFAVSNAVRDIQMDVIAIHRAMKDVALAKSSEDLQFALEKEDLFEKKAVSHFPLLYERFLGDPRDIQKVEAMLIQWKGIRDEVITLSMNGQRDAAALITKGKGASHVTHLLKAIDNLKEFADAKGTSFFESANQAKSDIQRQLVLFVVVTVLLSLVFSALISRRIYMALREVSKSLSNTSSHIRHAFGQIDKSSSEVHEAAVEQKKYVVSTSAAANEISMMAESNHKVIRQAGDSVAQSEQTAEGGRRAVSEMSTAISGIDQSQNEFSNYIARNSQEISEIADSIAGLNEKTQLINDIVFQTKLLSFNASVEAARAGEAGKGFAVVAEEIANLASVSGQASTEISSALEKCVTQVHEIIASIEQHVKELVSQGRDRVEEGKATAGRCSEQLSQILDHVRSMKEVNSRVSDASKEQSTGVKEIMVSIQQLEQIAEKNVGAVSSAREAGGVLRHEVESLSGVTQRLLKMLDGRGQNVMSLSQVPSEESFEQTSAPKKAA